MVQEAFIKQVHLEKGLKARLTRRTGMAAAAARRGAVGVGVGAEVMDATGVEVVAGTSVGPGLGLESEEGAVREALDVDEDHPYLPGHEAGAAVETGEDGVLFHPGEGAWMTSHLKRETCEQSFACSFLSGFVRGTWRSSFQP